ncbi:hydrocephalus-inducing protein homolog [Diachasmimorpha longicaudata]|uniref:hydrocephalus-inducing protein homolog n=1 Tax=Diachasmimorpha longicaudata TaxID=58733 RepID=UPI0030B8791F
MYSEAQPTYFPFSLSDTSGTYSPGESGVISSYFKPTRGGSYKVEIIFEIDDGKRESLKLLGRGIEQKVRISESRIIFAPGVPGATRQEKEFSIKSLSKSPLEFAWQHLNEVGIVEERIMGVLIHYYGSKEILLPVRQLGAGLPKKIYEFYEELIGEMKSYFSINVGDELEDSTKLHNYIDILHQDSEFPKNMKDPVAAIFAELNSPTENPEVDKKVDVSNDMRSIIFYGAPFTKYQETACKTARKLDIPLLNLDSAMTEVIATGESPASSTVRQLINERYQELLTDAQKLIQDDDLISRRDTSERILNSDENDDYLKGNVDYTFFHPPDPLISFRKIPGPEDLEILDLLSQYEYKIEALSLLEKILGNSEEVMKGKLNVKGVEKMSKMIKTSQKNTLANIEVDSFADILKEVLMKEELKDGFVLQTLNNVFIEDHSPTFSKILESIPPESIAFINFHNSLETYQRKVSEKLNQIAKEEHEKLLLKLKVMDEMSLSEFEKLSEDDKNLFFEKIQRPRIEEARERREKFKKKISKPKVEEVLESSSFSTEDKQSLPLPVSAITENLGKSLKKKGQVTMKGKQSSADARNDQKEPKIGNIKANGQQQEKVENPRSDQAIAEAMELYNRNFNTIKSMIDDRSKTWVAAFADPWCPTSYDFIVDRIVESRPKKDIKSTETKKSIPQIAENIYSIYSYNKDKPFFPALPNEVPFQIGNIQEAPGGTMNARTILDAGEVKRFKVVFQPQEIGDFHQEFLLNVIGNHHKVYRISLSGIADIPRFTMDPKSIFTRIKETKIDEIHDPTFFVDTKTFDFGFLLTPEKHLKEARVHHKIAKFNFSNSSLINADVHYSLLNEHSKGFSLNKSSASVPPDENEVLTIIATAPQLGPNTDKLLIKIINNTQVEEIMLKSSGCQLNIEVQGKVLDFGRILLYRKDCRRVTLKNKTPIRVFWRILEIIDENGINPQISYSSSSGVIEPLNETHFDIYFHGQLVGTIVKETIRVGIFLFENDEESLLTEDINISAEVYDVSVDVNDANPIDLKTVKIGERTSEGFSLKNQGQYDINFVLQLEKFKKLPGLDKKLFKNFKDYLKINPLAGTLGRNKLTSINLDFIPKMEMKLKNLPIIKCNLFDTSKDATLIAEIPLTITITAQYSKFTIEPYPELFGGSIPILTHKNVYFTIRNVGIFPIEYKIDSNSFETTQDVEIIQILPPKLSKNPSKKKGKKSVIDVPSKSSTNISIPLESDDRPLNIGPFTLLQREGTIAVGQMTEITIDCNPQVEGKLTKNIFIKCSNCSAEDQNGRQLILTLDSCTPKINFDDFSSIFHHSYMAETVDDFTCTYDNAYSIFSKQDKTLHFEKVIVSSLYRVELKLYNPGLVPAEVKMTLRSEEIDEETNVFNIEPRRETIPPMTSRIFTVSFTPIRMCTYSCILEAAVVLPDHLKFQKLSVKLSGDGCIPEITFIEPNYLYKQGTISLNFGKCLLGQIQTKILVFKNTGKVKAKVIAEIIDDINSLYYLEVGDAGGDVHGVHRLKNNFVEIVSNSGDTSKILVLFEAREIGIFDSLVRIFLSDNPYEVTNINLKAEGFIEPVVIKGLTLVDKLKNNTIGNEDKLVVSTEKNGKSKKKKGSITQKMKKSSPGAEAGVEDPKAVTLAYELDAGICPFEEERVLGFEMVNTCEDKWFRFEFDSHNIFHFIPSVGHLNPLENKKIIMKFSIREPVVYERLPLNCFVDEIQLAEIGEQFFVSWDDQQTKTVVEEVPPSNSEESYEENCTTLKEINYPVREPRYELICKESEIIQLVVSAMAAWTTYYCPVEEINFDDTFILEPNSDGSQNSLGLFAEFNNENKTEDSRTDASIEQDFPILSRCFKILPETGVIFPNETTEFRLTFSPEEKRQYNAILICEIACLNPQTRQLKIPISGKALLPHCHFDIPEFSDDYLKTVTNIENLLETMKIIEFRIIGVGGHHTKQFNLINPSDNSYKFSWKEKTLRIIVNGQEFPYFCCERTKGIATMREKTEMTFSFFAKDVGTFESLWEFCIDEFEVKVPFLLVGVVTEPRIICCPSRVQFKPTVIRTIVEESVVLTNYEDNSLDFSVVRNSLFSDGGLQRLFVEPMTGILVPKNGTLLTIKFKSAIVGNFDFSLGIQVEKMREPLCILIAARVCEVIPRLIYIGVHNETMELQSNYENTIDLGKMMIKKPIIVNFELWNMGELPFQYQWNLRMDSTIINKNMFEIKINAPEGEVQSTKTVRSCLSVVALKKMNLTNHRLTMKIINGPIFTVLLNASAKVPPVKFSFTQYDFGACYIRDQSQPYEVLLRISNEEENPALVEVKAENLQNFLINSDPLSQAISTRTPVSVPIYFLPAEEQKYEGHLIFIINSTITKRITVRGEGICPKEITRSM